jgi:hypothetical protein
MRLALMLLANPSGRDSAVVSLAKVLARKP